MQGRRVITKSRDPEIISAYSDLGNMPAVAKQFNVHAWNIRSCLNRNNVAINPRPKIDARDYKVNDHFFDDPLTFGIEHAYFLGWLFSDGNLSKSTHAITFSLAEQDRSAVETLASIIGFTGPIRSQYRPPSSVMGQPIRKHQDRAIITVNSERLWSRLTLLEMDCRKSVSTGFPYYLKENLWNQFLLGVFEGDGTFSFGINGKAESNLVVNPVMANDIEKILFEKLQIVCTRAKRTFNNGSVTLRICGNNAMLRFLTWLYRGNVYRLQRKCDVFKRLVHAKANTRLKHFEVPILKEAQEIIHSLDNLQNAA